MNIQADKCSDIVFHGLPPESTYADHALRRSACGSTHRRAQPTISLEADHLQPPNSDLCGPSRFNAGWGHVV
ncbi:hypothetical protein APY03_0940 [Variovorax sp. WDL1]|nr:hypothetical protein APY03_0940 [Variovorax sp. WDL1]